LDGRTDAEEMTGIWDVLMIIRYASALNSNVDLIITQIPTAFRQWLNSQLASANEDTSKVKSFVAKVAESWCTVDLGNQSQHYPVSETMEILKAIDVMLERFWGSFRNIGKGGRSWISTVAWLSGGMPAGPLVNDQVLGPVFPYRPSPNPPLFQRLRRPRRSRRAKVPQAPAVASSENADSVQVTDEGTEQ
jgi:hypothetical protein